MGYLLYKNESYEIVGAIIAVQKELGCGYLERVYQDALEYEFKMRKIPYEREKNIQIMYKSFDIRTPVLSNCKEICSLMFLHI